VRREAGSAADTAFACREGCSACTHDRVPDGSGVQRDDVFVPFGLISRVNSVLAGVLAVLINRASGTQLDTDPALHLIAARFASDVVRAGRSPGHHYVHGWGWSP